MQRIFREWALTALTCVAAAFSLITPIAHATHFQGATIHAERAPLVANPLASDTVTITFDSTWRRSFPWLEGTSPPPIGATLILGVINYVFTNGESGAVPVEAQVIAANEIEDLITTRYVGTVTGGKTLASLTFEGCCRSSDLAEGNNDASYRIVLAVPALQGANKWRSAKMAMLPRVYATLSQPSAFTLPMSRPEEFFLFARLAPIGTSRLTIARPVGIAACFGPAQNPPNGGANYPCTQCAMEPLNGFCTPAMSLAASGGVTWSPQSTGNYAVQFDATRVNSFGVQQDSVPVDMIVNVIPACVSGPSVCAPPPSVTVASTYAATGGIALSIPVTVTSTAPQLQSMTLFNSPLPDGATLSALSGSGPSQTATLSWTPTFADYGDHPVCFQGSILNTSGITASSLGMPCVVITVPPRAPDAPTNVVATRGNASASVTFTPPAIIGSTAITGYTVTSNPPHGTDTMPGAITTTRTIAGLTNGTPYTFTVVAANGVGNSPPSAPSNNVTPATVPQAPFISSVVPNGDQSVVVNVVEAGSGGSPVTGLAVTSSPLGGTDTNTGTTVQAHVIRGLTNGTAYTFRATATNEIGTSPQSNASASITPLPIKPTIVKTFATSPIVIGQTSLLTITVTNPNPVSTLAGLTFTDNLPAGVRATADTQIACGGTVTITAGAISLAGGSLAAGSNCAIAVNVRGASVSGTAWTNTISNLTTTTATLSGFNPTTSAPITVSKASTSTTITSTAPASTVIGQPYVVNYDVTVTAPGVATPIGTVTVSDGTNSCTGTLPATSCTLPSTAVDNASLTATYNGSSSLNGSASTAFTQAIGQASTTTTVISDLPDPSVIGAPVLVTATVAVVAPGTGTPTGGVTVSDGVDNCVITLPATSCNWTPTTVGARTLTASYSGDARFSGSVALSTAHAVVAAGEESALTITKAGSGSGTVSSNVAGISCGATCAHTYAHGTTVTLTATPDAGSAFTGWLDACTDKTPCVLNINSPVNVSATFAPDAPPLNLDIDGNTNVDLLTDGLLLVRYLSLLPDSALVQGAIGDGIPTRTTAEQVRQFITNLKPRLDVDGDGVVDVATDGVLLLRYLSGVRGEALIVNAVGNGARRTTAAQIEAHIVLQLP